MLNNRIRKILAVVLFAALSWLGWPAGGFAPLLFVAWIPLLALEDTLSEERRSGKKSKRFTLFYLGFFLFNLLTTWWIYFASPFGMAGAVLANALLMTFVFLLYHHVKYAAGEITGYLFLVSAWTGFEFLHMDWDLSWPWLNMGNGFGADTNLIQWYEYTGTGGGTIWILAANILIYRYLKMPAIKRAVAPALVLILPVVISYCILYRFEEKIKAVEIVVVQPNIDPYNEKFSGLSSEEQLDRMLKLANEKITDSTALCLFPETALPEGIWEEHMQRQPDIRRVNDFISRYQHLNIITGAATYRFYKGENYPASARKFGDSEDHYDAFNTALLLTADTVKQVYHKSKLVPGVEKMPFPAVFGYLDQFAIDLGGIAGSLGIQDEAEVFKTPAVVAAPVICYESIYGEYVGSYILKGANLITIITNDGWWSDTPGYRQHIQYARLRAIEHRRSIARCANTGISCFINQRGDLQQVTRWWEPAVIRGSVNLNSDFTFYTRYGDWPGRLSLFVASLLLAFAFFRSKLRQYKRN